MTTTAAPSGGGKSAQELSAEERLAQLRAKKAAQSAAQEAAAQPYTKSAYSSTAAQSYGGKAASTAAGQSAYARAPEVPAGGGRVLWGQAEKAMRAADAVPARRRRLPRSWLDYGLRAAAIVAEALVVTWLYGGDAALGVIILACAAGVFARAVAAPVVPRVVGVVAMLPFALAALIPAWSVVDALLRRDADALLQAGIAGGLYVAAVVTLVKLPPGMAGPFKKWMP